MQQFNYHFHFSPIPRIFKRGRHALVVIKTPDGKYLLSGKTIYPSGIYRLIGGGIDGSESSVLGAAREVKEELQIKVSPTELRELAQFTLNVTDDHESFIFETFVYLYQMKRSDEPIASDDIQTLVTMSKKEVLELANKYKELPSDLVTVGKNTLPDSAFRWSDYGQFYGELHRIAIELAE